MVNAALILRRPLLVSGSPGVGKSSLVYAVAEQLGLGQVLVWPINSRTTLQDGLYQYDALGRLRDASLAAALNRGCAGGPAAEDIAQYVDLTALGTALATSRQGSPRALLIDEIDKSDVDLPNDLLNVLEEGSFRIPELVRAVTEKRPTMRIRTADRPRIPGVPETVEVDPSHVACEDYPFVLITSNDERELPPAFLRRCLRLRVGPPVGANLDLILKAHLDRLGEPPNRERYQDLLERFQRDTEAQKKIATDQLLNAIFLVTGKNAPVDGARTRLVEAILKELGAR
jgi:MoxR-like ATPase